MLLLLTQICTSQMCYGLHHTYSEQFYALKQKTMWNS